MIVYIDNTVAEYLKDNELNVAQENFFASLALSYRQGNCIVFGHVDSITSLIDYFGMPINGIYKVIQARYSECGAVVEWITKVFVISFRDSNIHSILPTIIENKACYLSCSVAANMNWSTGACFVGENISDCTFYEIIAKYYAAKNKIRNVRIHFHQEHGGGVVISSILRKCVKEDRLPTLCIVDSDLKNETTGFPQFGNTYLLCDRESADLRNDGYENRFYFCHNQVHEIENLVPLSLLKKLVGRVCYKDGIRTLEAIESIDCGKPILFYDFKKGITSIPSIPDYDQYWNLIKSQTTIKNDKKCFSSVVYGQFVSVVVDYIINTGISNIFVDQYLIQIWEDIGRIVFSWGCGSCPIRA